MNEQDLLDCATENILASVSDSKRQMVTTAINDVTELEKINDNYTYLYLNEDIFPLVMQLASYRILLHNMLDNGIVDPNSLSEGTQLLYSLPENNQMQSVIFCGPDQNSYPEKKWLLRSVNTRGAEQGVVRIISTSDFISRVSVASSTSTRRAFDSREKFAESFGIQRYSRTSDKQIIILAESSDVNNVTNSMLKLGDTSIKFGSLFQSRILKTQGGMVDDFKLVNHTNKSAYPFITFATNINALWAYLNESKPSVECVYLIGKKWWTVKNQTAIEWIISYAKTNNISIHVISTVAAMMNRSSFNAVSESSSVFAWFDPQGKINTTLKTLPISESPEEIKAWQSLTDFMVEFSDNPQAFGIVKWIGKLRRVYFSTVDPYEKLTKVLLDNIKDAISYSQLDGDLKQSLTEVLTRAIDYKLSIRLDSELKDIGYGEDTLILTNPVTANSTAEYLKRRGKRATVFSFNAAIEDSLYSKPISQIVLINPTPTQRRKWLFAGFGGKIICLYPESSWYASVNSMQNDVNFAKMIADTEFMHDGGVNEIVTAIRAAITDAKKLLEKSQENENQSYDEPEDDFDDIDQNKLPTGFEIISELRTEQNTVVTATIRLRFENNNVAILLGTPNGKVICRRAERFESVRINNLTIGDVIAYVGLEDCIKSYRKEFIKMSNVDKESVIFLLIGSDERMDFLWKRTLINFVEKFHLSSTELQGRFASLGYHRSVAFFKAWSTPNRLNFVPHDVSFIEKIGELTKDEELVRNSSMYYKASQSVREHFQSKRQSQLERLEYENVKNIDYPISYLTVSTIEKVNYDINRAKTNRVIEKPEEEFR